MVDGITITGQGRVRTKEITIDGIVYHEQIIQSKDLSEAHRIDEVNENLIYVGYALAGSLDSSASWSIKRISKSGTVTSTTWADGNTNYDNIWDNRINLTYS